MNPVVTFASWLLASAPGGSGRSAIRMDTDKIQEARNLIDTWLADRGPSGTIWNYSRSNFSSRLKELVSSYKLNQGCLDCCAFTSLLFACLRCYPVETVRWAMNVFDNGSGDLGGFQTTTNDILRNKRLSDLLNDNPTDSGQPKYPDFTDWILQTTIIASFRSREGIIYNGMRSENNNIGMKFNAFVEETDELFNLCTTFFLPPMISKYDGERFNTNDKLEQGNAIILILPAKFINPTSNSTHVVFLDSKFTYYQDDYNGNHNVDWIGCRMHNYGNRELLQIVKNTVPANNSNGLNRIVCLKMKL
ncbi:MAG: hypothetical protein ACO1G9_04065 [Bacteroidota bacterium]